MTKSPTRRAVVRSTGVLGTAVIAGCSSIVSEPSSNDAVTNSAGGEDDVASLESWLEDANGFDGDFVTLGTRDPVQIQVGYRAPNNPDADPLFRQPAVKIPTGTTVRWKWANAESPYNVVARDGAFDSGDPVVEENHVFEHTFQSTGSFAYYSEPNREDGMKGGIKVVEPPSTGYPEIDDWLAGVEGFDGTVTDLTGQSTATISVGTSAGAGNQGFEPLVAKVSPETTVQWEWSGKGGDHSIEFESIDIDSPTTTEAGVQLEHTFEHSGTYRYACLPHRSLGAKAALVVE
jgi:halocyanin-like protein